QDMSTTPYKVIGTRPVRHDGVDKVTGRALYGADLQLAGLLHGRILRSPHAHARIRGIDASAALALPGVVALVPSPDLPDPRPPSPPRAPRSPGGGGPQPPPPPCRAPAWPGAGRSPRARPSPPWRPSRPTSPKRRSA